MTRYDDLTADECQNCGDPAGVAEPLAVADLLKFGLTWDGAP